ncbi:MAG: hypothetical protein Fur0015_11490 [Ignavibacteriales bacterium]
MLAKISYWLPRVFGIIIIVFISAFALDVFDEKLSFIQLILALLIHLIPSYILMIVLLIAWKREIIGSLLYSALAVLYLIFTQAKFPFVTYAFIMGGLFLNSILFLVGWKIQKNNFHTGVS